MKFKKILLIFSILISQSISAMDLDLGSNFILEKEYKNYAKIGYFDKGNGVKFVDSNHTSIPINIKSFSHF